MTKFSNNLVAKHMHKTTRHQVHKSQEMYFRTKHQKETKQIVEDCLKQ